MKLVEYPELSEELEPQIWKSVRAIFETIRIRRPDLKQQASQQTHDRQRDSDSLTAMFPASPALLEYNPQMEGACS